MYSIHTKVVSLVLLPCLPGDTGSRWSYIQGRPCHFSMKWAVRFFSQAKTYSVFISSKYLWSSFLWGCSWKSTLSHKVSKHVQWLVDSPQKGPGMQKVFQCHSIIMKKDDADGDIMSDMVMSLFLWAATCHSRHVILPEITVHREHLSLWLFYQYTHIVPTDSGASKLRKFRDQITCYKDSH